MSPLQLLLLAIAGMLFLAAFRLVRVRQGKSPHPEGARKLLFVLGFVLLPPFVLALFLTPGGTSNAFRGIDSVPPYAGLLIALAILMWVVAQFVSRFAPGGVRAPLLLALVGTYADPFAIPEDPPVTPELAESVRLVDRVNAAFPRGPEFPGQVDRPGFRDAWTTLDAATGTLEGQIAEDFRLGLGVSLATMATARDARSRLDTLRGLAIEHGQVWSTP